MATKSHKYILVLFFTFLTHFVVAQEEATSFNSEIFLSDEILKFGEEYFLSRIGLTKSHNTSEFPIAYKPIHENQTDLPVGLVLSGGAARAFAHIGVLRKLEAEGIKPDFIVTNSMGSLIALLYAAGLSPDSIEKIVTDYPMDKLFTARLPLDGGVIDDYNMISTVYALLGEKDIKDLEIPIVVLAEDLLSRRTVAFMEGDFYSILSSTIAMPISFPPVRYNDMVLIDGGTTNLVPIQNAAEYTDRIIVSTSFSTVEGTYKDVISVVGRALDLGKTRTGIHGVKTIDNILIRCDVEDFHYMEFDKAKEIIARGEESAALSISEIIDNGFHNTTTWTDERESKLQAAREKLAMQHDKTLLAYERTNTISQKEFAGFFSAGFQMYSPSFDDYYLDNSDYFYLSQKGEIGTLSAELREVFDPWNGIGLDGHINFSLFGFLSIQNRLMAKWNKDVFSSPSNSYEGLYYYGNISANLTKNARVGIKPFFAWETNLSGTNMYHTSFARSGINFYVPNVSFTTYAFLENLDKYGLGLENELTLPITDFFFIRQKTISRFPFDFNNSIHLYENDGLRGYKRTGLFDYFVVTNNNATFKIFIDKTFFESIVLNDVELSAFADYYKTDIHGYSLGANADLHIAIVGLVSIVASGHVGYDMHYYNTFGALSIRGKM